MKFDHGLWISFIKQPPDWKYRNKKEMKIHNDAFCWHLQLMFMLTGCYIRLTRKKKKDKEYDICFHVNALVKLGTNNDWYRIDTTSYLSN